MSDHASESEGAKGTTAGNSFQVVVLGAGGGPMEDNCTALLVRSTALRWSRASLLAVDAGVHLSAIDRLLQQYHPLPPERPYTLRYGILSGLELPYKSRAANTAHIARNLVGAHLITHPHLDHISGGIVSTSCPSSKPRKIAGLASTIEALKDHIFNDIIWPNLSDENGGVGLVTFLRLNSGGSSVLGDGVTQGYMEVVEGLGVKSWAISHGVCSGDSSHRHSHDSPEISPSRTTPKRPSVQSQHSTESLTQSSETLSHTSQTANFHGAYTSSAFFIHDIASGQEILIWGDVEADSLSANPRNKQVWIDAAPKVAAGNLKGIFIECSYDDSRPEEMLFGHLSPRYVIEELKVLASEVEKHLEESAHHAIPAHLHGANPFPSSDLSYLRKSIAARQGYIREREREKRDRQASLSLNTASANIVFTRGGARKSSSGSSGGSYESKGYPLKGVKVVLIHLKEKLDDGEELKDVILRELEGHQEDVKLGCEFLVGEKGMSVSL